MKVIRTAEKVFLNTKDGRQLECLVKYFTETEDIIQFELTNHLEIERGLVCDILCDMIIMNAETQKDEYTKRIVYSNLVLVYDSYNFEYCAPPNRILTFYK